MNTSSSKKPLAHFFRIWLTIWLMAALGFWLLFDQPLEVYLRQSLFWLLVNAGMAIVCWWWQQDPGDTPDNPHDPPASKL